MALQTNHTTDGFHCRPGIAGRQNNPLKYTDPSGYVERYAYWDGKSSGGGGHGSYPVTYDISQYFTMGGAGAIGPGSGKPWSDPYRGGFGNFMLMNSKNFDRYYGSGPYAKAVALYDNKSVFHQWGSGGFGLADVSLLSIKWNPLGGAEVGREQYRKDGTNYLDIYYEGSWALDESQGIAQLQGGSDLNGDGICQKNEASSQEGDRPSAFQTIVDYTVMVPIDFAGAAYDFGKNYFDMRKLDLLNSDKYFHSKANFQATRRGPGGAFFAIHFSNLREIIDQRLKGDSYFDSMADQKANMYGRELGWEYRYIKGPIDYSEVLNKYRYDYFPEGY